MDTKQMLATMERKAILSTLWIFVLFNMIFRDIHELFRPGLLEEMISGTVNGMQMSEGLLLLGSVMIEIAIVMVLLSHVLKVRANRWANIVTGTVTIVLVVMNNTVPDLDDMFFAAMQIVALAFIIWYAWHWPNQNSNPQFDHG